MDNPDTTADLASALKECLENEICRDSEIRQLQLLTSQISQINAFSDLGHVWEELLNALMRNRLCKKQWHEISDEIWFASVVQLLRIFYRDPVYQEKFYQENFSQGLHESWKKAVNLYFEQGKSPQAGSAIVRGLLSITQKLFTVAAHEKLVIEARIHELVVPLLSSKDLVIAQAATQLITACCNRYVLLQFQQLLHCNCAIAASQPFSVDKAKSDLCKTNIIDQTLLLLKNPDLITQKLASSLLRLLCTEAEAREQVKVYDGINIILALLPTKNIRLQWHLSWTLAQLAEDEDSAQELGQLGAIDLILAELSNPPDLSTASDKAEDILSLLHGYCATLSNMCQVDENVNIMVRHNAVYVLSNLLLLSAKGPTEILEKRAFVALQCSIFRALRLMFSMERHRQIFKRLFPAEFFASFIDIGHYVSDLNAYEQLVYQFQQLLASDESGIRKSIESVNKRHEALFHIQQYAVMERLGAGAFGCVYKVHVPGSEQCFALKEIYSTSFAEEATDKPASDKARSGHGSTSNDIGNEIAIIRQQMRHPNIVRYRKIFIENAKLYILMDLIDGAPLKEHINSIKEKKQTFSEDRIWNVLIQMIMALRYLHKEKRIVHRDLNPNNVMLADNDHVIITDFGLAKHQDISYLKSVVGTILYSSPELIQHQPYGEKVDIWSLGCIVYEMCSLVPPFFSQNMLKLASSIVEAKYSPIPDGYGSDIKIIIEKCLTPSPTERPDVIGVSTFMVDRLLLYADLSRQQHHFMKRRMQKELAIHTTRLTATFHSDAGSGGESLGASTASAQFHVRSSVTEDIETRETTEPSPSAKSVTISSADAVRVSRRRFRRSANKIREEAGLPAIQPQSKIPRSRGRARSLSGRRSKRDATSATLEFPKLEAPEVLRQSINAKESISSAVVVMQNIRRAQSSSTLDKQQMEPLRALSATSVIINSAKLRTVGAQDPMLHLFIILHKMLVVDQLPVIRPVDHKRRVIEQFRKQLFGPLSDAIRIRTELAKLASQSTDPITWNLGYSDYRVVLHGLLSAVEEFATGEKITYLTYQQLAVIIDAALEEYQGVRLSQN